MSFTSQLPFVVTDKDVATKWGGFSDGRKFRCALCGHRFVVGDTARWVCTNFDAPIYKGIGGNPFVCSPCDAPKDELLEKLQAMRAEFNALKARFWWFK